MKYSRPTAVKQRPIALQPYGVPTYTTAAHAIADYHGDDQIYALYPRKIEHAARRFVGKFPGEILYAVKANPHPTILHILWDEGIRQFDVASVREIDLIADLFPSAQMYLMHPVKSRATIAHAYGRGVRDFAFDHHDELQKIIDSTSGAADLNLHLRLALPKGSAAMPLDGKFGADTANAIALLRAASPYVNDLGISFHVGSQCMTPSSYDDALSFTRKVVNAAGVDISSIDVGGGFPVSYPDMPIAPMEMYFTCIEQALTKYGFAGIRMIGEPGRALSAEGGATLARIELRKEQTLYLNDGTYGSLFDAGQFAWKFPVRMHRIADRIYEQPELPFRFFGPTCDSADVMNGPFHLPADIQEGDWVEIQNLGSYGQTLATQFNGFYSNHTVAILEDINP